MGRGQPLQPLLHPVGEDADDAQHLRPRVPEGLHHLNDAASGGDQILHHHHLPALFQPALNLVLPAMVLLSGADIAHGQPQQMGGDGGVGNAGGSGAHERFHVRVFPADGLGQGVLHIAAHLGVGEGQAVVAVHRALDAAGPDKGLLRAEEYRANLQQVLGNFLGDGVWRGHICHLSFCVFGRQPTNSATHRR